MKALLLIILIYVSSHSIVRAQYCGSNGIPLTSQANIDNFAANYPGCIVVQGYVFIAGNDITNLNGLSQVTDIMGDLQIWQNPNLTSLTGLSSLKYVDKNISLIITRP
ncbi:hypothetical protein GCM10010967_39980 [Dyadobacter beijingensis]|uniref:Receptor L-domain domain-containing protein n=1 Tax=Dyadobacter beijingensis TaxID=365489 RepID=A0ABQ2I954_9BACT|nr:hypothetical protein [Dyadobacter beijingensis]GGN01564.1 hypothetical protein GCM10010967_39980 [Dyadobacter beijingensis]